MSLSDERPDSATIAGADARYFADRASPEFDEVVLQSDYTARATLNFWRFRQLGGDRPSPHNRPEIGGLTGKGVHYVSDHPKVRLLNLSIIGLLVLFESAANAYFFAQQSEFGLSGGVFQAAAVSLANVATAYFIIGFWGLRHITVPWTWKFPWERRHFIRIFALIAILAGLTMVLLVNLSAAHYRNIIDLAAEGHKPLTTFTSTVPRFWITEDACDAILTSPVGESIGSAATNAMCRPFALHSLDAMVLFALGIAISALAAFEGRRADSPFPGLSDAARQLEGARRDLQAALEDYYDSYGDVIDDAKRAFKENNATFTLNDEVELRRRMDDRIQPYRAMLTSEPDLLRDEFAVPSEAVELVTRRSCTISDRTKTKETS